MLSNSTNVLVFSSELQTSTASNSPKQYALCLVHSCKYTVTENNKQHINNDVI